MTHRPLVGRTDREPIAIVGIGCRFPGAADPSAFWKLLVDGVDAIREIPRDRFDLDALYDERPAQPGKVNTRWGGFVDGLDQFDAEFFGISPREAERLDPQQRLLLETAWEAVEDAGVVPAHLHGTATGVFVGMWINEYESRLFRNQSAIDFYMTTGTGRYAASGRLSYHFGLHGPSLTLDTGCSSSLVAVHLACQSLWNGESDLALAGAANAIVEPFVTIAYSQSGMMAPDGRCKFGDAAANGYVRSDGAAIVVLKPLSKAIADGNPIYATILGSAVTNDGRGSGFMTTPAREGQEEMLRRAYRDAGVSPGQVQYVEAHGTGTRAGDPVELGALGAILAIDRPADSPCRIGSVKTNIGHTEGAAGMAGLIKTALSLKHRLIPKNLHLHTPNPDIPWSSLPLTLQQTIEEWPAVDAAVAGVSSFGISGTNAHVVLAEPPVRDAQTVGERPAVLTISGHNADALRAMASSWRGFLAETPEASLAGTCFSAADRRAHHAHRAAFVAENVAGAIDQLDAFLSGEAHEGASSGQALPSVKVAFVFPGQGSQWVGMARDLYAAEPAFRDAMDACDRAIAAESGWSVVGVLLGASDAPTLDRIDVIQPALFAVQVSLAALWSAWGVRPDAVVGHSMGEVAAACVAGALSVDDAARVICLRSRLMKRTSGNGAMAVVELDAAAAAAEIEGRTHLLGVAVSNSSRSSVLSGDPAALDVVLAGLEAREVFCRRVQVDVASHSPQMDPLCGELLDGLREIQPRAGTVPFYSTALASQMPGADLTNGYWVKNLRNPVMFASSIQHLIRDGHTVFIEMSPHPVLVSPVREGIADARANAVAFGSTRREEDEQLSILASLGTAYTAGVSIDWQAVYSDRFQTYPTPRYAFQRERFWFDAPALRFNAGSDHTASDAQAIGPDTLFKRVWRDQPRQPSPAVAADFVIAGESTDATSALKRALENAGARAVVLVLEDDAKQGYAMWLEANPRQSHRLVYLGQSWLQQNGLSADAVTNGAWSLVQLTRHAASVEKAASVAIVSSGAQQVSENEPVSGLVDAALWGLGRTIAEEFPARATRLIDVDSTVDLDARIELLASELLSDQRDGQVALRKDRRAVLRLEALTVAEPATGTFAVRAGQAYVITGGFGALGLHVARWLARQGARRLILVGRTPLPPRAEWPQLASDHPMATRVAGVRALEAQGVSVHHATVDVADHGAVSRWFAQYRAEAWPAVAGVFHCAGVLEPELIADLNRSALERVLDPKVRGVLALEAALAEDPLHCFVLFSSAAALLPIAGQANYAAGNAFLDGWAEQRRASGKPATSINWAVWDELGMAQGLGPDEQFSARGFGRITPALADAAMARILGADSHATAAVMPILHDVCRGDLFAETTGSILTSVLQAQTAADDASRSWADDLRLIARGADRRYELENRVRDELARVVKRAAERIDLNTSFRAIGLDSLMGIELRNRLRTQTGLALSATVVWNYPNVATLAAHLAERMEIPLVDDEPAAEKVAGADDDDIEKLLLELAALPDDEARRLLEGQN